MGNVSGPECIPAQGTTAAAAALQNAYVSEGVPLETEGLQLLYARLGNHGGALERERQPARMHQTTIEIPGAPPVGGRSQVQARARRLHRPTRSQRIGWASISRCTTVGLPYDQEVTKLVTPCRRVTQTCERDACQRILFQRDGGPIRQ